MFHVVKKLMIVSEIAYKLETRHKITLLISFSAFTFTGVLVILSSLSASQAEMILSMALFISSLLVLVAVTIIVSKKSTVIEFVEVTPIKAARVEPREVLATIIRNRLFQAVAITYAISIPLMILSRSPQSLPVFLTTLPAFLTAIVARLCREVIIAREGLVVGNTLTRWDKIGKIDFCRNSVVLQNGSGVPIAVLPRTPEIEEILRERVGKQNV